MFIFPVNLMGNTGIGQISQYYEQLQLYQPLQNQPRVELESTFITNETDLRSGEVFAG